MNCRRIQKLIPLHVEGDLRSSTADRVASHLEWCGRCNWLADEYKESQSWLRSSQPPEFNEAMLYDLRRGVLKRVAESGARPSLFASLAHQWSRRQILVLSATFFIVLGVVALYFYHARMKVNPDVISEFVKEPPHEAPKTFNGPPPATVTGASKRQRASSSRRNFGPRGAHSAIIERAFRKPLVSQTSGMTEAATALTDQKDEPPDTANGSREMLRIEIQTSDPSIRIIWFAPKQTDLQQSKPATD
ncbi:MAG: zf-HC2 domain-containing protein [Acidobacteriota bacterium]